MPSAPAWSAGGPSTPTRCADTPTSAKPSLIICAARSPDMNDSPADTLFHSTITVPLNACGSRGRTTSIRERNGASPIGSAAHRPSVGYCVAPPASP